MVLITSQPQTQTLAEELVSLLSEQGYTPRVVPVSLLADPEKLPAQLYQWRQELGKAQGVVHLPGLATVTPPINLEEWRYQSQIQVKSLFQILQVYGPDLREGGWVLSASALGGAFGRDGSGGTGLVLGAAAVGLLKSLQKEWPRVRVSAVDLDLQHPPAQVASLLLQEAYQARGPIEVGYPLGVRHYFRAVPAPLTPRPLDLDPQMVVLLTGGGRGITAEVAFDLAAQGVTLVLVGRSPQPAPESPQTSHARDASELRQVLLRAAQAAGESPTPAVIEARVRQILGQRHLSQTLDRLRRAGAARVDYRSADVRQPDQVKSLLTEIYHRHGRLDGVVHAAGVIEDKLVMDKSLASFERVFDTKADSAFLLSQGVKPAALKFFVFFSSVAGRFGNRAQSDYAAANETLNRLAWQLHHQWPQTRVVAINWGPWASLGMASPEVLAGFEQQGILPIPPAAGRAFFRQELGAPSQDQVEVVAGVGPWENPPEERPAPRLTLISQPPTLQGEEFTLEHTFSLAQEPYLQDHCLLGKPVVPAALALEWLAQLVQQAWPQWLVTAVCDLQVLRGVVLEAPERLVCFQARPLPGPGLQVLAQILDPAGRPYYRARVLLGAALPVAPKTDLLDPLVGGQTLDPAATYRQYLFHGPRFQLLEAIPRVSLQGIDATVRTTLGDWLFDPFCIDVVPQLAIVWARQYWQTTPLPVRWGKITRHTETLPLGPLQVHMRITSPTPGPSLAYEALVWHGATGQVCFHLQDLEGACNAALNTSP